MARHKTAHRKALEARNRRQTTLRAAAVSELADSGTLKANATKSAKKAAKSK